MKNILAVSILIIVLGFSIFAQDEEPCPTISVAGGGVVGPGSPMNFTVNSNEIDWEKFSYKWSVSNGTIISGQGTPFIQVDTSGLDRLKITATVEINSVPEGCINKASESGSVEYGCRLPITLDEYSRIPFREEKARLDNIAFRLKKEPDFGALFVIFFTKNESPASVKMREANITKYLTKIQKLSKEKLIFLYSERDFQGTKIYLLPPDAIKSFPDVEKPLKN